MPVAIRNTHPKGNRLHFSVPDGDSVSWGIPGVSDGSDVQEVSDDVFKSPRFRRLMKSGVVGEISDEEFERIMDEGVAASLAERADRKVNIPGAEVVEVARGPETVLSADDFDNFMKSQSGGAAQGIKSIGGSQ